jgi:sulfate/thiosulfate transport system permease protein
MSEQVTTLSPTWSRPRTRWRTPSALPGFGPALGFTLFYLSVIVLIPLAALILRPWELGFSGFIDSIMQRRVLNALKLSFGASAIAALINAFFGLIVAWVIVRYRFPFKRFIDALIDLPFALPTAVAGIALTALYAPNGWVGEPIMQAFGMRIAYTPLGVLLALVFIGLPFVVRTLEPVMQELSRENEEAAATLGASRRQTFTRVILPALAPALITGSALAFVRAVGEYGSVIFIAGNLPNVSEIAPLLIVIRLEQFDYAGAAAVGVAMLLVSFVMLLAINLLQAWAARRS